MSTTTTTAAAAVTAPSKVLYFERLPAHWTERDLARAIAPAAVTKAVFLRKRNALFAGYSDATHDVVRHSAVQALVEVADVETAERVVEALAVRPLVVAATEHHSSNNCSNVTTDHDDHGSGSNNDDNDDDDDDSGASDTITVTASYSKNQELHDRAPPHARASGSRHHSHHARHGADRNEKPNRILLVTVQNPTYPITTDLVHSVFSGYGVVEKVVVFVKPIGLQTLVQFALLDDAVYAKSALAGLSIFPDCCSLQINFSNLPQELIVKENGPRSKDFTNPALPLASDKDAVAATSVATTAAATLTPDLFALDPLTATLSSTAAGAAGPGREAISPVLLVCSLRESVTCDHLFNLFSCYGNVIRVKKLSNKADHALVQFLSPVSAQSALLHLRGFTLLGRSMEISFSKYTYISIRPGAADNPLVKEYGHMMNRFTGKAAASAGKHVYSPTKILHLSNFEETVTIEDLKAHLASFHGGEHCKVKTFTSPSGHVQALAEFATPDVATNVLAQAHNSALGAKRLKLAFSNRSFH